MSTLVTTGIEDAVAVARDAAGDKDVALMGGGVTTAALAAGLVDEVILHQVPILPGGGRPFTNRELADALHAITPGLRLGLLPGRQDGPGDNPYLDTTRLTRDTGFTPAFDVAAAVADYVAWRADNPN
jgi:nucleoside-diphosphate-sugar epimerase